MPDIPRTLWESLVKQSVTREVTISSTNNKKKLFPSQYSTLNRNFTKLKEKGSMLKDIEQRKKKKEQTIKIMVMIIKGKNLIINAMKICVQCRKG